MNPLNDFFCHVFCVNLDRRRDRWKEAQQEFDKHQLQVERFSAVDGSKLNLRNIKMEVFKKKMLPGAVGCSLSHLHILQQAKSLGYENVLILEDDVVFVDDLNDRFSREILHLPNDWDMLYLSANNLKPECLTAVNEYFCKTTFSYTTHCYAVHSRLYDIIIDGLQKLEFPVDQFYTNVIQKNHHCYLIRPHLSWQRAGYSDIMKGDRDYPSIRT